MEPLFQHLHLLSHCFLFVVTCCFNLNEILILLSVGKSIISPLSLKAGSSLNYCNKLPDVFEKVPLYYIKLYTAITWSMSWASSTCVFWLLTLYVPHDLSFI